MRDLAARQMDFTRQNALMLVRINLVGVEDLVTRLSIEPDLRDKALTESCRERSARVAEHQFRQGGGQAGMGRALPEDRPSLSAGRFEEKNSDSPLGKLNGATGSPVPSGDTAISGGPSKRSSTDPAPDDGSATIIDKSSISTTDSSPTSPELNGSQDGRSLIEQPIQLLRGARRRQAVLPGGAGRERAVKLSVEAAQCRKGGPASLARSSAAIFRRAAVIATDRMGRDAQQAVQARIRASGWEGSPTPSDTRPRSASDELGRWRPLRCIYARGGDESLAGGALESYSRGATIKANYGQWAGISTAAIPRRVGRYRTSAILFSLSKQSSTIGKLIFKRSGRTRPFSSSATSRCRPRPAAPRRRGRARRARGSR